MHHQGLYAANSDPAARAVNLISLVLAWNGPLYPVYVLALVGRDALPWGLLTLLVTPLFYLVPWLNRRSSRAGRVALPVVGALNTVWCVKLFGIESGVGFFLYPCIVLAALLYREREYWLMLPLLGLTLVLGFIPAAAYGQPILHLTADAAARLSALNAGSVAFLLGFIALKFAEAMRAAAKGDAAT